MVWFWALVAPTLVLAATSLRGERRKLAWARRTLATAEQAEWHWPPATVIVPVKGPEDGLAANLAALAALDYPDFELIVATREPGDLPEGVAPPRARIVVAGPCPDGTGEKVHNLLAAIQRARPATEVYAFADSDIAVNRGWLRSLVSALAMPDAAASTGYRWHLPPQGGFWALLRSVWDSAALGMFRPGGAAFAWGGSMAVRKRDFEHLNIAAHWRDAVSDDYVLTAAIHAAQKKIAFAPGALSADRSAITGRALLEWVRRQLILTRVHRPGMWAIALAAHILYCASMAACAASAVAGYHPALAALGAQMAAGMWKGRNRGRLAALALDESSDWWRRYGWVHTWWTPLATWLWLYALVASAGSRRILWRGRIYTLQPDSHSPVRDIQCR